MAAANNPLLVRRPGKSHAWRDIVPVLAVEGVIVFCLFRRSDRRVDGGKAMFWTFLGTMKALTGADLQGGLISSLAARVVPTTRFQVARTNGSSHAVMRLRR
jgi:hypothetical protein